MRRTLTRSVMAPAQWAGASPDLSDAYALLTGSDVGPELAREIVQGAETRVLGPRSPKKGGAQRLDKTAFQKALADELDSRIKLDPALGRGELRPRIVAMVGPPGSGKTTTLVKLAVNYGLASRLPVLVLSMDTYRVAAAEQLRCYAAILGVGFQVLQTVTALAQTIEENRGKELIFVDTPGFGFGDMDSAAGLAQFLATRSDIDPHLVLPASMKAGDLSRIVDAFEIFRPQHLLFTKLDETGSFGPILNESVRTGKPLSFFTMGQRIPEDLETAGRGRLAEWILTGYSSPARTAA
jgi:flagellar biosynthesis protein FlhF